VAVYTDQDARASRHVRDADVALRIGAYLAVDELVDAAIRAGADAVHPGYGFVSERGAAARAFADAGITWVGPPAAVIDALGDKVRAKEMMAAAGLPLLPGGSIDTASDIGFPLLVKAAAGGGGRGMRVVTALEELPAALDAAAREAAAAFGDGTLFLERWLPAPRHVEVQVIADGQGHVVHLGERECSIQRRHQKVVEETPSPGIGPALRDAMTAAAVAGARAVGYVNAGTWEFLVDGDEFFFLEVNTRLQVEHPVTEAVTGLDLVRLQLEIAGGSPLPMSQEQVQTRGHAIEVRVVAEDPALGWLPSTGRLHRFEASSDGHVRHDLGFGSGSVIPPDYDSLLGKVVAHAATRDEAAARLAIAVDRLQIHGVATNRALLADLLREPDFRAGRTTTDYLDSHPDLGRSPMRVEHAVAATLWQQAMRRGRARVLPTLPSGWRNLHSQGQRVGWRAGDATVDVSYVVDGDRFEATVDGHDVAGRVFAVDGDGIDIEIDGVRTVFACSSADRSVWVGSPDAQTTLVEVQRFVEPGAAVAAGRGPTAPVPGTIIAVEVAPGDAVTAGQTLVVLEAMKLEHRIRAEADGVVESVPVVVGERVDAHQVLVVLSS
jgi:propionyl-CoA carboxylase alpha chain